MLINNATYFKFNAFFGQTKHILKTPRFARRCLVNCLRAIIRYWWGAQVSKAREVFSMRLH